MALAVMNVVDVIGTITNLVGIGLTIPGLLPKQDEHQTIVRIAAGLSSQESDSTGGSQPGVHLYDAVGRTIGAKDGKRTIIKDGDFVDIAIPFSDDVGKKPTEYLSIHTQKDDALCIPYIALTQPDGTKKAWYGDIGKACGADWYHSLLKTGDDDYQPSCIWIDGDHSNGVRYQGLGLHINDFAATEARVAQYNQNRELMCNASPRFRMYETMSEDDFIPYFNPPLEYVPKNLTDQDPGAVLDKSRWTLPQEGPNIKLSLIQQDTPRLVRRNGANTPPVRSGNSSTVVVSQSRFHSAKELCESSTSWGYDFVSGAEQLFCDMTVKKLWPVCGANKTSGCFDHETSKMRAGKGLRGRDIDTGEVPPLKSYAKTLRWA